MYKKGLINIPYAILRFEKRKDSPASALEKHHERKKETYASNPNIDLSRSHLNYHLVTPTKKYYAEIQGRIETAGCRVRKDSVRFIDTIVTASPELMLALSEEEQRDYFSTALEFLKTEVGEKNIFSAVVHMDERNPHMHLCFVPLTFDNRLSAKEIIGNRQKLVEWQDKFYDCMSVRFPQLERGEPASETKRKHIPTWLFKQANRLTDEMVLIRDEIDGITPLNAAKKKERALDALLRWYKRVNSFNSQLGGLEKRMGDVQIENKQLEGEVRKQRYYHDQTKNELTSLILQRNEYKDFIESIPEALRKQLYERFEEMQAEQRLSW